MTPENQGRQRQAPRINGSTPNRRRGTRFRPRTTSPGSGHQQPWTCSVCQGLLTDAERGDHVRVQATMYEATPPVCDACIDAWWDTRSGPPPR